MLSYDHGGDVYSNEGIWLDFSVNTNPMGMPTDVKRAVAEHIDEYEHYPDPRCRALRGDIAARHGVDDNMVLCGNGAAELIFRFCACLRPRCALTPAPTFSEYERAVSLFGGKTREHILSEENGFAITEDMLPGAADAVFLCNPNNPTGRLAEQGFINRIAEACAKNGTLLFVDECFMDFTAGESATGLLRRYPNLLILRAFTKIFAMAGLRLGYLLCADTALLSRVAEYGAVWNVSAVAQEAGLSVASGARGWIEDTRRLVEEEREYMASALSEMGVKVFPSDANFLLIKCPRPLYEPLKARGILLRACDNFSGLDSRFVRIGLKTREKNEALICAFREIING